MKKSITILLAVVCLFSMFFISGCNSYYSTSTSTQKISYGKKYIFQDSVNKPEEKLNYIVINRNGTGEYYNYSEYYDYVDSQTVDRINAYKNNFKYLTIGDTLMAFYDSTEALPIDFDGLGGRDDWKITLIFSENILLDINGKVYICEDFLPNIPNYKKSNN